MTLLYLLKWQLLDPMKHGPMGVQGKIVSGDKILVSVILNDASYGHNEGLWEVMDYVGNETPDGVTGYLTLEEVDALLGAILCNYNFAD